MLDANTRAAVFSVLVKHFIKPAWGPEAGGVHDVMTVAFDKVQLDFDEENVRPSPPQVQVKKLREFW